MVQRFFMADTCIWRGKYTNYGSFFIKYLRTLGFDATNDILLKMLGILGMHLLGPIITI